MNKKTFIITIFFLLQIITVAQTRIQFPPIQTKTTDASFLKFIDTLHAIVQRKDFKKICTLVNTNIVNGFDSALDGIKNFKKFWREDKENNLWMILNKLLTFGGQYSTEYEIKIKDTTTFVFPYFFDEQIVGEHNFFDLFVVNGDSVNMRTDGTIHAAIVSKLSYEVVRYNMEGNKKNMLDWQYVETLDKKYKGYIKQDLLYNFIDYRVIIHKRKGIWKIDVLVSGD
jgi:hypothetical protein